MKLTTSLWQKMAKNISWLAKPKTTTSFILYDIWILVIEVLGVKKFYSKQYETSWVGLSTLIGLVQSLSNIGLNTFLRLVMLMTLYSIFTFQNYFYHFKILYYSLFVLFNNIYLIYILVKFSVKSINF